uniref:Uncharacterized protein n=1 Tax=Arundo donax TaxID=35708 RepID=A0A0A9F484_ARUDO
MLLTWKLKEQLKLYLCHPLGAALYQLHSICCNFAAAGGRGAPRSRRSRGRRSRSRRPHRRWRRALPPRRCRSHRRRSRWRHARRPRSSWPPPLRHPRRSPPRAGAPGAARIGRIGAAPTTKR